MEKKNNKLVIILLIIIIIILGGLCYLFATDKIIFNHSKDEIIKDDDKNNVVEESENTQNSNENDKQIKNEIDYNDYVGIWKRRNDEYNSFSIKSVSNNKITFDWFIYRLADVEGTIDINDGKAVFYFEGYHDIDYNGPTEDEKYARKGIIELKDNKIIISFEDIDKILDSNNKINEIPLGWSLDNTEFNVKL